MSEQPKKPVKRRRHPLSSIRAKMTLILLSMAATSAACGFAVFFAFERIAGDMSSLAEEKLPQMEQSSGLIKASGKTKDAMVAVMLAQNPAILEAASEEVSDAVAQLKAAVDHLTEEQKAEFSEDVIAVETALIESISARSTAFQNSSWIMSQTNELQSISSTLQEILVEIADDAYFNLTTGGEETMSSIDATLVDLVETKFATLQTLLETRAEINLMSGVALALGGTQDSALASILTDLASASNGRLTGALETLESTASEVVSISDLSNAHATVCNQYFSKHG